MRAILSVLIAVLFSRGAAWSQSPDSAEGLVRSIEAAMVRVEAGSFVMGNEAGLPDSRPAHAVVLNRSFRMLRHEATFEEYDAYCALAGVRVPKDQGWG